MKALIEVKRNQSRVLHVMEQMAIVIIRCIPDLQGQYKNYLIHSLKAYKSGSRQNAIMSGFAAGLSDQDIIDLSTYYSKQKGLNILPKN
jgi:cytochrome c553